MVHLVRRLLMASIPPHSDRVTMYWHLDLSAGQRRNVTFVRLVDSGVWCAYESVAGVNQYRGVELRAEDAIPLFMFHATQFNRPVGGAQREEK